MWDKSFRVDLKIALANLSRRGSSLPVKGEAAVLLPILLKKAEPELLLTRRTEKVGTHKGQVSFPGGKKDAADRYPVETALRETQEELGIPPQQFEVLGRFHDYLSITEYRVVPVVAICTGNPLMEPNPHEVAKVLRVPISFFQDSVPREEVQKRLGQRRTVYFYDYQGEVVWGLTAAIIRDFCHFLGQLR